MIERDEGVPGWFARRLARPDVLAPALIWFAVAAPLAQVTSCNVHEVGHAAVGTALGWEVDRLHPCSPGSGSVEYARTGARGRALEGVAGGLAGAAFVAAAYGALFVRAARPSRGPGWWAAGLGVSLWFVPQVLVGILEGAASAREGDYTDLFADHPAVLVPAFALAMVAGGAAHVWRWRAVWDREAV